jgi:alkylation response protein AidB-like acyl-CoA dehydrogenase
MVIAVEELCWGDVGLYLSIPNPGLGGAAVAAAGTAEQKERFLSRFKGDKPTWGAMAITEPSAGSDSAAIQATAKRDGDHWVLNGTKIFCTSGLMAAEKSEGFVVVWASLDRSAGRAGIRAFVVDAGTPGMYVTKVEDKLGIRASDTATIVLEDCRIPLDNILGSPEVPKTSQGFKGVMATFDATRPIVAASALGVARAALDFVRDTLKEHGIEVRYGAPAQTLTALERDFMEMEAQVQAARLLTWRAAWMIDNGIKNNLEASMCKAKAGLVVTWVTQKAVEATRGRSWWRSGCATRRSATSTRVPSRSTSSSSPGASWGTRRRRFANGDQGACSTSCPAFPTTRSSSRSTSCEGAPAPSWRSFPASRAWRPSARRPRTGRSSCSSSGTGVGPSCWSACRIRTSLSAR